MKHIKKLNEGWFSKKKESNPEVDRINDKIQDASFSLNTFGAFNKQASFVNGAKWAIHNLTDEEIKLIRENTDKDDFSFFGF
jgi:hypothetical protein